MIVVIALLTAVFAASVALAAGWLVGVVAAFAGSLVAYFVTGVAARREATRRSAQEAAIAAAQRAAVEVAVAALGERDGATADHSDDVVELAAAMADRMRVDEEERRRLLVAAQLHDLGKVAIPSEILHKPGPLDDDEWEVMRTHTPVGERILRSVPELADVATIVRHSHEHFDGSGYPDGLVGQQIPISSRIILCADAYHAIRSDRPYRAGRSAGEALTEIQTHAGRQFDPQVASALERAAKDARSGRVLSGPSRITGSRRLAALLLVLSVGSGAALAADGPARSMIEDADAAGPSATSQNATAPGQPCLLLDPSSAVCSPGGAPILGGNAPALARTRFTRAGESRGLMAPSGAGTLPVMGIFLPESVVRPSVGAIGSPESGRRVGGATGGPPSSPATTGAPSAVPAPPRPVIWPGTPAAADSQQAMEEAGFATPGVGSSDVPGAELPTLPGVGDDQSGKREGKSKRGRGRGKARGRRGGSGGRRANGRGKPADRSPKARSGRGDSGRPAAQSGSGAGGGGNEGGGQPTGGGSGGGGQATGGGKAGGGSSSGGSSSSGSTGGGGGKGGGQGKSASGD